MLNRSYNFSLQQQTAAFSTIVLATMATRRLIKVVHFFVGNRVGWVNDIRPLYVTFYDTATRAVAMDTTAFGRSQ